MKILFSKILEDKKLTGIILLGIIIISVCSYLLVFRFEDKERPKEVDSVSANVDVLIPKEEQKNDNASKSSQYQT